MHTHELRERRATLLRYADALAGPDRKFATDEARASFDATMAEIADIDERCPVGTRQLVQAPVRRSTTGAHAHAARQGGDRRPLDYGEALLAEVLDAAGPRVTIIDAPSAEPLPGQRHIVERAIAAARSAGLSLPKFELRFVERRGQAYGSAAKRADGAYVLALAVDVSPRELRRVAMHELAHLHDFAAGAHARLSSAELELRAIRFAARFEGERL